MQRAVKEMKISETTEKRIWNYLNSKIQNPYGTAGLMGNLYAESGLLSINLQDTFQKTWNITDKQYTSNVDRNIYQDFINDGAGYGLAQWTYPTRKQALLEFSINRKVSVGNLKMQLDFLINELSTSFKDLYLKLKNTKSIEEASDLVLTEFERPKVINNSVKRCRQDYSQIYLNKYGKINTSNATVKSSESQKDKYILNIINKCGTTNTNQLYNRTISYIVLHYAAGLTSKTGSAINLATACANGGLKSSAEFYVDDTTVVQYIEDIKNRYSWSVGGNKYPQMTTSLGGKYYGICTNMNSINIEICNEKVNKNSYKDTDTDWYFTDAALKNAVALTKFLMEQYNIDIDHVIMHHEVNGKNCPYMWSKNEASLSGYYDFINRVKNAEVVITSKINNNNNNNSSNSFNPYLVRIAVSALNIRDGAGVEYKINDTIRDKNLYTIVEEKNGWGKLKSGIGWINLKYIERV